MNKDFENIINLIGDPIFVKDDRFRFTLVNDACCQIMGMERKNIIGNTLGESLPAEQMEHFLKVDKMVLESGVENQCEELLSIPNGKTLTLITKKTRYVDEQGRKFLIGLIHDITSRKEASDVLEQSETRYRELFDKMNSGVSVYETSDNGEVFIFKEYNAAAEMIDKTPREKVIGRSVVDVFPGVKEFGLFEVFQRVYKTGQPERHPVSLYKDKKISGWRDNYVYKLPSGEIVAVFDDITKSKQAENELRESEELLRSYLESAPDGVYMMDLQGTFLYGNQKCEEIIGYRREELIGKNFVELNLLTEKSLNKAFGLLQASMEGKPTGPDELELINKEGRTIPVEISTSLVVYMRQKVVLGFVRDITMRRQAEEKTRESEEKLRSIIENSSDQIFMLDKDYKYLSVNRALTETAGKSPQEMIGISISEIYPENIAIQFSNNCKYVFDTGNSISIKEKYFLHGRDYYISTSLNPVRDGSGKVIAVTGIARDITEAKQAEEEIQRNHEELLATNDRLEKMLQTQERSRLSLLSILEDEKHSRMALLKSEDKYRSILENMEESYFEVDIAGNFTFFNDAMCRLLGYSRDELMGMNNRQFATEEYAKKIYHAFNTVFKTGQSAQGFDWELIRKDGARLIVETSISLMKNTSGQPVGFSGIAQDITGRKQAEENLFKTLKELQESKDMLVQSEKLAAVGRLSAGVAHEILNPINIISMRLELLEVRGDMPGHFVDTLRICRNQIDRVVRIAKDLNQFSRIASTEYNITDLNELIKHIIEMTAPRFNLDKVKAILNLSEDLTAVSIDKNRIEQVLLNLTNNAIDAMEGKEEKTITITTSKEEPEKGKTVIRIAIADNGTGVKEEEINKIFDPFFTTKAVGKGTGLGLSITHGIIQDHKGRIRVENNESGGATFIIELPVEKQAVQEDTGCMT
jgi:PAS domain S-box-containing protein